MKSNPRIKANILSKLFFIYNLEIVKQGFRGLDLEDMYEVVPDYDSKKLRSDILKNSKIYKSQSALLLIWKTFGLTYVLINLTQILSITISLLSPRLVSNIVAYYIPGQDKISDRDLIIYGSILIIVSYVKILYSNYFGFWSATFAIKVRSALTSYTYGAILKMRNSEIEKDHFFGKISTIITTDFAYIERFIDFLTFFWPELFKMVLSFYIMYKRVGRIAFIILIIYLIFAVANVYVGYECVKRTFKQNRRTEERVGLAKQILEEHRTVKIHTWEDYLIEKLKIIRKKEVSAYFKIFNIINYSLSFNSFFYRFSLILVILLGSYFNLEVNADNIYFIISCLNVITFAFKFNILGFCFYAGSFFPAIKRTTELLNLLKQCEVPQDLSRFESGKIPRIRLENVHLNFGSKIILEDSCYEFKNGLYLIKGSTGSGKTALLKTITGFYKPYRGFVRVEGVLSYASQEPWLFPGTIRENIVFTEDFDEKRYREVLKICALDHDFGLLEKEDLTIVVNNGINFSKGQKARINLARAVYKKADIYLLDDCLSSLDILVANNIFKNCLLSFLKNKIVLFASHRSNYEQYCNYVLDLNHGSITIRKNDFIKEEFDSCETENDKNIQYSCTEENNLAEESCLLEKSSNLDPYHESKRCGNIKWETYQKMMTYGNCRYEYLIFLFLYVVAQFLFGYAHIFFNRLVYIENQVQHYNNSSTLLKNTTSYYSLIEKRNNSLILFSLLTILTSLFFMARGYALFRFFSNVSINLYKKFTTCLIKSKTTFLDNNFMGNILNRLTLDVFIFDKYISQSALSTVEITFELLGTLIMVCIVNSSLIIPCLILGMILIIVKTIYLKSARELTRLTLTMRSSMIRVLASTLDGLPTIKALNAEDKMKNEFDADLNMFTSASYMFMTCVKGFLLAIDLVITTFTSMLVAKYIFWKNETSAEGVGLILSQSFHIGGFLGKSLFQMIVFQNYMTSIERLLDYTNIETENVSGTEISEFKSGKISYNYVSLRYNESKNYVLKKLNFTINPGEKIGIVGRTGSGKSSIISALFRLYDIEGKILIDNIDHKTFSLHCLRSKISMIPQDSFIFRASLRDNIDPLRKYSDDELCKLLKSIGLKSLFLDYEISSESCLSTGEKQLISLARILVNNNKIVVFDEASENLDSKMSEELKTILKQNIDSCTIISISHKIDFVLGCDKILLLDNGEILEFDYTSRLLNKKDSVFYKMVKEDGIVT